MSDPIPEPNIEPDSIVTFDAPNVLHSVSSDAGRTVLQVSSGGRKQVVMSVKKWFSDIPVEPPFELKILAKNNITVGGVAIKVLNDGVEYDGQQLAPSNPTAAQYLALVGQKVVMSPSPSTPAFSCTPVPPGSPLLEQFGKATLYSVKQVSIVLP